MDEEKMKQLLKYLSSLNQANQLAMATKLVSQAASLTQPKAKVPTATSELTEQEKKDRNLAAVTKCKQYKIENIQRLEGEVIDLDKRKTEAQRLNEYLKQQIREQLERRLRSLQEANNEEKEDSPQENDEEKEEEK